MISNCLGLLIQLAVLDNSCSFLGEKKKRKKGKRERIYNLDIRKKGGRKIIAVAGYVTYGKAYVYCQWHCSFAGGGNASSLEYKL